MKKKAGILSFALALILAAIIVLPGCASPGNPGMTVPTVAASQTPAITQTTIGNSQSPTPTAPRPVITGFGRFLSMVPCSFLQEHDIWYGDAAGAWSLHGIEGGRSVESLRDLPPEKSSEVISALVGTNAKMRFSRDRTVAALTGFDTWLVDRTIFSENPPPWSFSINEGEFDEDLIKSKLMEQGYARVEYGPFRYSCYSLRGDNEMDLRSELGRLVLTELNRVAVLDGTIITASTTGAINSALDVRLGKEPAAIDNAACEALAGSLGEVLGGVVMTPDQVLNRNPSQEIDPFYFDIPSDWGKLHNYEMGGMGYRHDGKESSWVISLFYPDAQAASADADTLVNRLRSYFFYSQNPDMLRIPERRTFDYYGFSIGQPSVRSYPGGATLTVECRGKPWLVDRIEVGDLLFLVPDPAPYVAPLPSPTTPPVSTGAPFDPEENIFSSFMTISIGAKEGYNDLIHQEVKVQLDIRNDSTEKMRNVRVILSTMAVNEEPRPAVMEIQPETPGLRDFPPGRSEKYSLCWDYDGSGQTKEQIAALVEQTKIRIEFTAPDEKEMTQDLVQGFGEFFDIGDR